MESNNFFKIILFKHPPVRKVFVNSNEDSLLIFGYVYNKIYISKIVLKNDNIINEKNDFHGEILQHDQEVVSVFYKNDKYYGVDIQGCLFTIEQDSALDAYAEYDLFEDSPEKTEKWKIENVKRVIYESTVLRTCFDCEGQLALLTTSGSRIALELVDFSIGESVKSILIQDSGILQVKNKQDCLLEWIPQDKIVSDFFSNWFQVERKETGFFLLTLSDGSILAVFPDNGEIEYIYIWISPFVMVHWDFFPDAECFEAGSCRLTLVSVDGGVVQLTEMGEMSSSYLPAGSLKAVISSGSLIYFSDWKLSYRQELPSSTSTKTCFLLPLKGILCWAVWGPYTLALSRAGEIYAVDNRAEINDDIEKMLPDSSLTSELIIKNAAFEEVNVNIAETDVYIMAILLSKKEINFTLNAQMLSVRRSDYTLCLVMKCLTEGVTIHRKDWLLGLSLSLGKDTLTSSHKLRENILPSVTLTQVFSFTLPYHQSAAEVVIRVSLFFSHLPLIATYLPVIQVGKVEMDPSYLLLPAVELETEHVPQEPDIGDLLCMMEGSTESQDRVEEKEDIKIYIKLSENYSKENVFKSILNNSKALWRTSLWENTSAEKKLEISVVNKLVTLEISDGTVTISGKDHFSCYITKQALFASAPNGCSFKVEPSQIFNQLEAYSAACEALAHTEKPSLEKLDELRKQLRENITNYFSP